MTSARWLDHPSELVTAAYLDGTLDPEATERIEVHLASCTPCRSLVREARAGTGAPEAPVPAELLARAREMAGSAAGSAAGTEGRSVRAASDGWTRPLRWTLAGAVATAAVVVIAVVLVPRPSSDGPGGASVQTGGARYRASDQEELTPLAPVPGARIVGPEATFTWSSLADADRYIVTVVDTGGTVLATIEARAPETSAVLAWTGKRPAALFWKVRALRLDRTLSESRPVSFEMR